MAKEKKEVKEDVVVESPVVSKNDGVIFIDMNVPEIKAAEYKK